MAEKSASPPTTLAPSPASRPESPPVTPHALRRFGEATGTWFAQAFAQPTPAQAGAWEAIADGDHTLVVAPTGSGKTLSAFLWSIDRILSAEAPEPSRRCRVLYVSPLKALAADVERNLRSPLVGIRRTADRLGLATPAVTVAVRTGDTPPAERRRLATAPPDVLITTPESLFLVLTSAARAGLAGVETVILDEVHVLAGSKRGAHLAVSLERLDALLPRPAQRIGLSATVRPVETVMSFLAGARPIAEGGRPVRLVQPPSQKELRIDVELPVPDLTDLDSPGSTAATITSPAHGLDLSGDASGALPSSESASSIWPHTVRRLLDIITQHRTTLVFTNGRRTAERLTARLNEEWAVRTGALDAGSEPLSPGAAWPAQMPGQSGTALGIDGTSGVGVVARAHHGSMSREERTRVEDELKAGRLPAVVATSSLELGIDMGSIDVVVQIGSPPSVASALQRIGRAGHQVGAVSHGVVLPTHRADLVPSAVAAVRARAGEIEHVHPLTNPLDVLAQQIVAMLAVDDWSLSDLAALVRRATPFATLGAGSLDAVLDMLAGRYPSEDFASLRARIVWDRDSGTLSGRPGTQLLAATSGGTIPERGLFGVYLVGLQEDDVASQVARRGGRRVGELDEEMVFESRVGDTFTLGTSTWRIEQITPDRVLVTPAPGVPGRLPFWHGDQPARPAELGAALGRMVREATAEGRGSLRERLATWGVETWALDNLESYLAEQIEATGYVPTDSTIVVERFRDDIGDWRIVIHSPYGSTVHGPWAVALAARLRERLGMDVGVMHTDDGIVLRIPDVSDPVSPWDPPTAPARVPGSRPDARGSRTTVPEAGVGVGSVTLEDLLLDPDDVRREVVDALGSSAHFGARFREAAARSLLLPRRRPGQRQPLWQQRQRASQLLGVAARYPDFPVVLEAVRECLQDDFDTPALADLMRRITTREVRVVEVVTRAPSPFARSLLFSYIGTFLYDGDAPLAERRAAALTLDPELLAELLGEGATDLAELLDPAAVRAVEDDVMRIGERYAARTAENLADLVAGHGPLPAEELKRRTVEPDLVATWLTELERARRVIRVRLAGQEQWAAVEDAARLRDALGVALPVGIPEAFLTPLPDPLGDLVRRHARTHGPFTVADLARRFALTPGALSPTLHLLESSGTLTAGRLRPGREPGAGESEYCDADVLRRMRRRSLAAARADVEAVPARALGVFSPRWHQLGQLRGLDGVLTAVDQLAGLPLELTDLESSVLPARVVDYAPAQLDSLTSAGEVVWVGTGGPRPGGTGGTITLIPSDAVALLAPEPTEPGHPLVPAVLAALADGGRFFRDVVLAVAAEQLGGGSTAPTPADVEEALWDAVWCGLVTNDTLAPLRARSAAGGTTPVSRQRQPSAPRARRLGRSGLLTPTLAAAAGTGAGQSGAATSARVPTPPSAAGRWSLVAPRVPDPTIRATARAASLLERHGVVLRGIAAAEGVAGGFSALYPVLARLEESGAVRRGYLVEGQGAAQFALPECIDRLRADAQLEPGSLVMAASDPANPYGSLIPWPTRAAEADRSEGDVVPSSETPSATTEQAREPGSTAMSGSSGPASASGPGATTGRPRRIGGADVVLVDGELALFVERGGGSVLGFATSAETMRRAVAALAEAAPARYAALTIRRVDGENALTSTSPLRAALVAAGFVPTPKGLRLRLGPVTRRTGATSPGAPGSPGVPTSSVSPGSSGAPGSTGSPGVPRSSGGLHARG